MPPPRPHGTVKDLSKDRADSKKNVTQQNAKLADDWAKQNAARLKKALDALEKADDTLQKLKKLEATLKEDDERRKKVIEAGENIVEGIEKSVKDMVKVKTEMKGVIEVKGLSEQPLPKPPSGADIAGLAIWVALWLAWVKSLKSKL